MATVTKRLICMSMLLLAVGCNTENSSSTKDDKQTEKVKKQEVKSDAKTVKFYLQREPLSMDPRKGGNRGSAIVLRELFEGLMRINSKGIPAYAAAKDVELSEDKCTYRFTLRPSVWSNGMPVTAYDFEYAWKSNLSPQTTTCYSYAFYCIKNARQARMGDVSLDEVGIKAEDANTLVVTLEHPAPYFIELTSNPIYSPVCKAVVEKSTSWCNDVGPEYVCNGPFVLDQWKHRSEIVLAKNPSYWDAPSVAAQKISFPLIEDPQTALNMFESGCIDWAGDPFGALPLEAIPRLKTHNLLQAHQIGNADWMELNTSHPLLSSAKIRNAMAMAINRQDIADHLLQGGEKPAYSILPTTLTLLKQPTFKDNDTVVAAQLMEEGLRELNLSRDSLPVLGLSFPSETRDKLVAEAIQQQWQKALGVKVVLKPTDRNAHLNLLSTGSFDTALVSWFTFFHDPIYNLEFLKYKTGSFNSTNWEDPYYISLLDLSDEEPDTERRNALLCEAEEVLMKAMPVIPICYNTSLFVKNPKVTGEGLSPIGVFEWKRVDLESGTLIVNKL
ncbi:MAG: peptide ABC transporter substrate-binding protein [Verrucomicrobia bacterium]|nr:peptide ABC transporter substrate-binding protein [Verrucomicrobiota bacterium]